MSEKEKVTPQDIKRVALSVASRLLVVHCGFCLDDDGRVDRNRPIGWIAHIPKSMPFSERWWAAFNTEPGRMLNDLKSGILSCQRCGRYLRLNIFQTDNVLTQTFCVLWQNQRRTTLKEIGKLLYEARAADVDTFKALKLIDVERDPEGSWGFLERYQVLTAGHNIAQSRREQWELDRDTELETLIDELLPTHYGKEELIKRAQEHWKSSM